MTNGGGSQSHSVSLEKWKDEIWADGKIGFHQEIVTPALVKWWSHAVSQLPADKRASVSVLVPLCGASRDLAWLLDRPEVSTVVGIEISELALQRLLSENPQIGGDASHRRSVGPGVECWESPDGRLKFYLADLFSDSVLSELRSSCQLVWDRGSLVAIDVPDRERYVKCLKDMCEPQHVWLIESVEYDRSKYPGPPHAMPHECTRRLFGPADHLQHLEYDSRPDDAKQFGLPDFSTVMYCLTVESVD